MHNIVGKKVIRVDGHEKVTGKAVYGDDICLHTMLHAACRFTDIPSGKIKNIDLINVGIVVIPCCMIIFFLFFKKKNTKQQ